MRTLSVISFLLLLAVSCGTSRQMSAVPEQKVESSESNPYGEYSPNTLIIMCDETVKGVISVNRDRIMSSRPFSPSSPA